MQNKISANKCPILLNNGAVIVVKFDSTDVQLPFFKTTEQYAYVAFENGRYRVIDEQIYNEIINSKSIHTKKKNTVVETPIIDEVEVNEEAVLDETH